MPFVRRVAVALAVVGTVAFAPRITAPNRANAEPLSITTLPIEMACGDCGRCGFLWLDHEVAPKPNGDANTHECIPGDCSNEPPCNTALKEEMPKIWLALLSGDMELIRMHVQTKPDMYAVNEARQALQVNDCAGNVIANLPLSKPLLATLTE